MNNLIIGESMFIKKKYYNDQNENDRQNKTKIIKFKIYYNDNYEHEIHFDEFA